ncbi:MAG: CPBP family intramembrane metalloprotease [Corallococcus sp.]|nr:CPBP family intramembrane metalloprotease [Corallococcus sp.]
MLSNNNRTYFEKKDGARVFALLVAVSLTYQVIVSLFGYDGKNPVAFWLVSGIMSVVLGCSAIAYAKLTKTDFAAFHVNRRFKIKDLLFELLIIVALINVMIPLNNWLLDLIEGAGLNRPTVDIPTEGALNVALCVIVACVMPAFFEEISFRGAIAYSFASSMPKWKAAIISGALFSLFHTNPAQTVHQFVLGMVLAYFALKSGSLWLSVIGHFFNNILAVVLSLTVEPTGVYDTYGYLFAIAGIVLLVPAVAVYLKLYGKEDGEYTKTKLQFADIAFLSVAVAACAALWIAGLLA